jgi:branched-chain amino acid transport system substrate-binding protein
MQLKTKKIKSVAITYTNNDYGKGLADMYKIGLASHGIKVTTELAHEDGKADYSSEVATLASAGGDAIAVLGYLDQGGKGIIQAALDSGAFDTFVLGDGMVGQSLVDTFGKNLAKSIATRPGSTGKGAQIFALVASAADIDPDAPYTASSYDAGALLVLAIQAGGSPDRASIAKNVMDVANGPGTKIYPGELKKALDLLAKGKKINYEGASDVTFTKEGDATGSFLEQVVKGGKFETSKQR